MSTDNQSQLLRFALRRIKKINQSANVIFREREKGKITLNAKSLDALILITNQSRITYENILWDFFKQTGGLDE